jgi:hypothetical protein
MSSSRHSWMIANADIFVNISRIELLAIRTHWKNEVSLTDKVEHELQC